jgi:hypothetical protein
MKGPGRSYLSHFSGWVTEFDIVGKGGVDESDVVVVEGNQSAGQGVSDGFAGRQGWEDVRVRHFVSFWRVDVRRRLSKWVFRLLNVLLAFSYVN